MSVLNQHFTVYTEDLHCWHSCTYLRASVTISTPRFCLQHPIKRVITVKDRASVHHKTYG